MPEYLTPREVSERFKKTISVKTLANWRSKGLGPKWTKIGGRVLYRMEHVAEWESMRTVSKLILFAVTVTMAVYSLEATV